jgi:hypothetical protein
MHVTALLDTDLTPKTVTHNLQIVPQTGWWANAWAALGVSTPVRRCLKGESQEASDAIYSTLRQMAGMANDGEVTLCDSDETFFESLYVKLPELRGTQFDMLRGVKRKLVRGPCRTKTCFTRNLEPGWLRLVSESTFLRQRLAPLPDFPEQVSPILSGEDRPCSFTTYIRSRQS